MRQSGRKRPTAVGRVQALTGSGISASSSDALRFSAAIPISVFIISDAGTPSTSRFHRAAKIVRDHAGIVFTFRWNPRSRCGGNRDHDEPHMQTPGYGQVVRRREPMCWTAEGEHLLLQVRCAVLDGRLETLFRERYPRFRQNTLASASTGL